MWEAAAGWQAADVHTEHYRIHTLVLAVRRSCASDANQLLTDIPNMDQEKSHTIFIQVSR